MIDFMLHLLYNVYLINQWLKTNLSRVKITDIAPEITPGKTNFKILQTHKYMTLRRNSDTEKKYFASDSNDHLK